MLALAALGAVATAGAQPFVTGVSVANTGVESNGRSGLPALSAGGRYVAFNSCASNLVPCDTNDEMDVFLRDRDTDANGVFDEAGDVSTTLVSIATDDIQGNRGSTISKPSAFRADGRYVVFESQSTTLAPGTAGLSPARVRPRHGAPHHHRLSVATDGTRANADSALATMSSAGRFVAFTSGASNLVSGDTNELTDVFLYERLTGAIRRISLTPGGLEASGPSARR